MVVKYIFINVTKCLNEWAVYIWVNKWVSVHTAVKKQGKWNQKSDTILLANLHMTKPLMSHQCHTLDNMPGCAVKTFI